MPSSEVTLKSFSLARSRKRRRVYARIRFLYRFLKRQPITSISLLNTQTDTYRAETIPLFDLNFLQVN